MSNGPRFSIDSIGSGFGGPAPVDPETGWHYHVEIKMEDGEEIVVYVGRNSHAWAKAIFDAEDGIEPPPLHEWESMPKAMRTAIAVHNVEMTLNEVDDE